MTDLQLAILYRDIAVAVATALGQSPTKNWDVSTAAEHIECARDPVGSFDRAAALAGIRVLMKTIEEAA